MPKDFLWLKLKPHLEADESFYRCGCDFAGGKTQFLTLQSSYSLPHQPGINLSSETDTV